MASEAADDRSLRVLAERVGALLLSKQYRAATAESCTGGWVAKCLTDIAGSSRWFERGYVTYSNEAKQQQLNVPAEALLRYGAVSQPVVEHMAAGALDLSGASLAVAITGIAGPDGGSADKPVGLVWFGLASQAAVPVARQHRFQGDREAVRRAAVATALGMLLEIV
jgi:nicotinamide-nucleotide amidase